MSEHTNYTNVNIFYYSGTGNTYRVASLIADGLIGSDAVLIPICKSIQRADTRPAPTSEADLIPIKSTQKTDLIGIMFPTHAFCAPLSVIRFAMSLPKGRGKAAFVAATRAGGTVKSQDPGCEGIGTFLIGAILKMKGYKIAGITAFDMPSNWIAVHPPYGEKKTNYILDMAGRKARKFSSAIANGKKFTTGYISFIIGLIFLPLTIAYLLIGKLILSQFFFTNKNCDNCGICEMNCPRGAVKMTGSVNKKPYWSFGCESCMRCMNYCPQKAIEYNQLMLIVVIAISIIIGFLITNFFAFIIGDNIFTGLLGLAAHIIMALIFAALVQEIIFSISKNKKLRNILKFMTFTSRFKRYHEPNTSVEDITLLR